MAKEDDLQEENEIRNSSFVCIYFFSWRVTRCMKDEF
jgi:hypothetical protein